MKSSLQICCVVDSARKGHNWTLALELLTFQQFTGLVPGMISHLGWEDGPWSRRNDWIVFFLHHKKLNANLYNFRGCEIWNPLLFMQGCESALRSSRAHWKAHLWTQVLIGVSHLWGIQKSDWNHRNETELFSNYYKNILKFVNILSSFLTKSDLQMTSITWQTTLTLTGRFAAAKLYGILASSLHTLELLASMWIKQKRGTGCGMWFKTSCDLWIGGPTAKK